MKEKIVKPIYFVLIGIILTLLTTISLIFVDAPFFVYSNIAGIILVSLIFGNIAGILFSVTVAIAKFSMNLSSSIISADLLKNITEVLIVVFLFRANKKWTTKAVASVVVLTLLVKPLYFLYYYLLNKSDYNTIENVKNNVIGYFKGEFVKVGFTYIFSISIACLFIVIYDKTLRKRGL